MVRRCIIPGCLATSESVKNTIICLHRISGKQPESILQRNLWSKAIGIYYGVSSYICSLHFTTSDFTSLGKQKDGGYYLILKENAVPCKIQMSSNEYHEAEVNLINHFNNVLKPMKSNPKKVYSYNVISNRYVSDIFVQATVEMKDANCQTDMTMIPTMTPTEFDYESSSSITSTELQTKKSKKKVETDEDFNPSDLPDNEKITDNDDDDTSISSDCSEINKYYDRIINPNIKKNDFYICPAFKCNSNTRENKDLKFHIIPSFTRQKEKCLLWLKNLKNKSLFTESKKNKSVPTKYRVCSKHFDTSSYESQARQRLLGTAVPIIIDGKKLEDDGNKVVKYERTLYCLANKCKNNTKNPKNLTFHRFPYYEKTPDIYMSWMKNLKNKISDSEFELNRRAFFTKAKRVCSKHFTDSCFETKEKLKLLPTAIPTIVKDDDDESSLTDGSLSDNTPKKRINFKCQAVNCKNELFKNPTLKFYRFPSYYRNKKIFLAWLENCRNKRLDKLFKFNPKGICGTNKTVCSKHFTADCFATKDKTKLLPTAIPTIIAYLSEDPSIEIEPNLVNKEYSTRRKRKHNDNVEKIEITTDNSVVVKEECNDDKVNDTASIDESKTFEIVVCKEEPIEYEDNKFDDSNQNESYADKDSPLKKKCKKNTKKIINI